MKAFDSDSWRLKYHPIARIAAESALKFRVRFCPLQRLVRRIQGPILAIEFISDSSRCYSVAEKQPWPPTRTIRRQHDNHQISQYQLWIVDPERDANPDVSDPDAFAIT